MGLIGRVEHVERVDYVDVDWGDVDAHIVRLADFGKKYLEVALA